MDIRYRAATEADTDLLADMRIAFLTELSGEQDEAVAEEVRQNLRAYYDKVCKNNQGFSELALDADLPVAVGSVVLREQSGNFKNPSGRVAYVMNMYTIPAYRRKGISTLLLRRLMDKAKAMGITAFELHATREGAPVYERMGYTIHPEPTYRKMEPPTP